MNREEMIIRCLKCGTKNRIPGDRMQNRPVCGRCRAHLDEMIIHCLKCGQKNRMPEDRLEDRPLCGSCGSPLVNMGAQFAPVELSDGIFDREMAHGAVLVDCWAPWCSPCRQVAPVIEELASRYAGVAKVAKLNVDENPLTAAKYHIQSIPTLLFFKEGALVSRLVGVRPKEEIEKSLKPLLNGKD